MDKVVNIMGISIRVPKKLTNRNIHRKIILIIILLWCLINTILMCMYLKSIDTFNRQLKENLQVKSIQSQIDSLNNENNSYKIQRDLNKILAEKESNLLDSADNTINKINSLAGWLTVFSGLIVTSITASGVLFQNSKMKLLERQLEKSQTSYDTSIKKYEETMVELDKSKSDFLSVINDYNNFKQEFGIFEEHFKSVYEKVAQTESMVSSQRDEMNWHYERMKKELDNIKDEVKMLAESAKKSEDNAKKSENISKASELFNQALNSSDLEEKIQLYEKSLSFSTISDAVYNNLANAYFEKGKGYTEIDFNKKIAYFNSALENYKKAIDIKRDPKVINNLGNFFFAFGDAYKTKDIEKAKEYYENSLKYYNEGLTFDSDINFYAQISVIADTLGDLYNNDIEKSRFYYNISINAIERRTDLNDKLDDRYNNIANLYKKMNLINKAIEYLDKCLKINPDNSYAYSTYAEINSIQNNDEGFYENLKIALEKGCPIWDIYEKDSAYNKYKTDTKFIELITKYKSQCISTT